MMACSSHLNSDVWMKERKAIGLPRDSSGLKMTLNNLKKIHFITMHFVFYFPRTETLLMVTFLYNRLRIINQ